MSFAELIPFLISALVLELTPGPNMALIAIIAINFGRGVGLCAILGIAIGLSLIGLAAILGMSNIIANSPNIYEILRWAGLIYLLYLAFDIYRGETARDGLENHSNTSFEFFKRGIIVNLLNPKAAIFFLVALPQFIPSRLILDETSELNASLILLLLYVIIATSVHFTLVMAGAKFQPLLQDTKIKTQVQRILAILLLFVAIWQFTAMAR